jgi:hypothetical protein
MRFRKCTLRLEQLEDRCTPSCVSAAVVPLAPLGDFVTGLVQSGLPGNGSPFGLSANPPGGLGTGFGNFVPPIAQSC